MKGRLIWITGLSVAGTTSVAKKVFDMVKSAFLNTVILDGDDFREIFDNDLGYGIEDRIKNAWRIVKMSRYLCGEGINIVCATMSLYKEIHGFIYETLITRSLYTLTYRWKS